MTRKLIRTDRPLAKHSARLVIIGAAALALLGSSCRSAPVESVPVATPSPSGAVSGVDAFDPQNDVAAQGSVRTTIAASTKVFADEGSYENLTAAKMQALVPTLRFGSTSTSYDRVSFQVRGESVIALTAMSPSAACFGALNEGDAFSYSHSDVGQASCNATDVPYANPSWPGSEVAQK